jgi:hypothetical protein
VGQPVSERLYFKEPAETFELKGEVDKSTVTLREKTVVDISASKGNSGIQADLSTSV